MNFDFEGKFDLEGKGQSPRKTIGTLTKVFYIYGSNLVILAWTGLELSRGQASDWHTDGQTDAGNDNTRWPYRPRVISKTIIKSSSSPRKSDNTRIMNHTGAGFESTACDVGSECYRFCQLMASWPPSKPKAAIYLLTATYRRQRQLEILLTSIFKYFNHEFQYPVIIFYKGSMPNITTDLNVTRELVFLQQIEFPRPPYRPEKVKTCPTDSPGPRLNIKTVLSTYGDFHVKDKTAVRTSYL